MKLKRINAVLGLFSVLFLLAHIGYTVFSALTKGENPVLLEITIASLMLCMLAHAVCGMLSVFLLGDGTRLDLYPKQNRMTVVQRVTAALLFPLLLVHQEASMLLTACAAGGMWVPFALLLLLQVAFYADVLAHAGVSLSRAFITLGWMTSREKQKKTDRVILIVFALVFAVVACAIVGGWIGRIPELVSEGGAA